MVNDITMYYVDLLASKALEILSENVVAPFLIHRDYEKGEIGRKGKTVKIIKALPVDYRGIFLLKPLPGSAIFEKWRQGRNLKDYDWTLMNFYALDESHCDIDPSLDPEYLLKVQHKTTVETIMRPKFLVRNLYLRFIKFFHFSQMEFLIERFTILLFGVKDKH